MDEYVTSCSLLQSTSDGALRGRGPSLDEDFVSGPHQDVSVAMDTTQMTQTRLSDVGCACV